MIVHDFLHSQEFDIQQGTEEWHAIRHGHITCSRFADLFGSPKVLNRYLRDLRHPPYKTGKKSFRTPATEWGHSHEDQARAMYEIHTGFTVRTAGFLKHKVFNRVGASPDGFVLNNKLDCTHYGSVKQETILTDYFIIGGVEIKCPYDQSVHEKYISYGVPENYLWQCRGYLWMTGLSWWDFISFDPRRKDDARFFVQRIHSEPESLKQLDSRVSWFQGVLDSGRLVDEKVSARAALLSGNVNTFLRR